MPNAKCMIILLTFDKRKYCSIKMRHFPEPNSNKNKIKLDLQLPNYATKSDLKKATDKCWYVEACSYWFKKIKRCSRKIKLWKRLYNELIKNVNVIVTNKCFKNRLW